MMFPMSESPLDRLPVSREELERAILVWLKVMPAALWRPYEAMLAIDPKRRTGGDRVDPREVLAAYVAGKFVEVRWEASRPVPVAPGSPPPWPGSP